MWAACWHVGPIPTAPSSSRNGSAKIETKRKRWKRSAARKSQRRAARKPYTAIIAETTAQIAEITASADHAVRCIALNGSASESRNVIAASSRTPLRSRQPQQHIVK